MKKITLLLLAVLLCQDLKSEYINWSYPVVLSTAGQDATDSQIAMDPNGNVVAIWLESGFVKFRKQLSGGSWSSPETLSGPGGKTPQIGIDAHGNITAAWLENAVVSTAAGSLEEGWGTVTSLSTPGADALKLATDLDGNCIAIWDQDGKIESSTKLVNGSWSAAEILVSSAGSAPQIAIGGNGIVVAVWQGIDKGRDAIFSTSKNLGGAWSITPQVISNGNDNNLYPQVAVDEHGNALAVWYQCSISKTVVQSAECPFKGSWSKPVTLSSTDVANPAASDIKVAFDSEGDAIVLWKTLYVEDAYGVQTRVRTAAGKWEPPMDLVAFNLYAHAADLAVDSRGEAYVAYMFHNAMSSSLEVHVTKTHIGAFDKNFWDEPKILSMGTMNGYPQIAASASGAAIHTAALWGNYNGMHRQVYAATGTGNVVLPPVNLTVAQSSKNFGLFTENYNTVSWEPSPSQAISGYIVFRNGKFFTKVPAHVLTIVDQNTSRDKSVTYGIAATDHEGAQSNIALVSYPSREGEDVKSSVDEK